MPYDQAYLEAEKKIEEARLSGAKELNLSSEQNTPDKLRLQEVPASIGGLTQLQTLILVRNKLTTLPNSLSNLTQLQSLQLSDNNLTTLPIWLGQFTQLQSIDASRNQLITLPESVKHLTQLSILDISRNRLTTLPDWLGQLTQLRKLIVWKNELISLPESIKQLAQLQKLYLHENKFTELPDWLGQLAQLDHLILSNNQLTALQESLGQLTQLQSLDISNNQLTALPESLGQLTQLQTLDLRNNYLTALPESLGQLTQLQSLNLSSNQLATLPESLGQLTRLRGLDLFMNQLTSVPDSLGNLVGLQQLHLGRNQLIVLPESLNNLKKLERFWVFANRFSELPNWIGKFTELIQFSFNGNSITDIPIWVKNLKKLQILTIGSSHSGGNLIKTIPNWIDELTQLTQLELEDCQVTDLPPSLAQLKNLEILKLGSNPLNLELAEAYQQGLDAVKLYLRLKSGPQITLNEAKLILVGEGEVGKTCLMDALLDKEWQEHPSTHGIEIQPIKVTDSGTQKEITLNGWDFGGQRVYRPTHQLFFSAPAVYLVVWKPREGPQQGFVKEWIQLVKRREPSAKILVVATHGGPGGRQPDIDRQELWDLFGRETVVDFFWIDSKPDEQRNRKGIEQLKLAIAKIAMELPEVGRSVPKSFQDVREVLQNSNVPYLPLEEVLTICRENKMDDDVANLFIKISHRLGHLTHYENDPALKDIVILRPDWLASAMSYILDDEETRKDHGLVKLSRLSQLWNDPSRPDETRYPDKLHKVFLRLMERFDISYRVAGLSPNEETNPVSLIAQLVPDNRPENDLEREWLTEPLSGDIQQTQICRIVDAQNGQSAIAEGLFYQLIVRLHRYTLGRVDYNDSVHWQRGLILEDEYKSRALLEHIGNDIRIIVRAPYPEGFLGMLTREVKYLVESFWEGLQCNIMVPCVHPCGKNIPGTAMFQVEKLINGKRNNATYPCPVCDEWQNIDFLLRNAPAAQPISLVELLDQFDVIKDKLDVVDVNTRRILSQVDKTYTDLLQVLTDEAKEGPRLFSIFPLDRSNFNPKNWIRAQFRLVLWCEHSRLPLPVLNNGNMTKGVYDLDLDREWFKKSAPYLKLLTGTLGMVLPIASSTVKLALDKTTYELIEEQLDFSKSVIDAAIGETRIFSEFMSAATSTNLEHGVAVRAENATLREFHTLLKAKDSGFGSLVRVMNKRQEFLWVHEKFAGEY